MANLFTADFETTTGEISTEQTSVWLWGACEINNESNIVIDRNIESFFKWAFSSPKTIYFHNLKFDGTFIIDYLLNNNFTHSENKQLKPYEFSTIISEMGQWYEIKICYKIKKGRPQTVTINDSLKKLPFSVKQIAKAFNLEVQKEEIDYDTDRNKTGITENDLLYMKNDVLIPSQALSIQMSKGLSKMTVASDALHDFKTTISTPVFKQLFPTLPIEVDDFIRLSYKGGWTHLKKGEESKEQGEGRSLDVNSLYPWAMYVSLLPYGEPLYYKGYYQHNKNRPLFIQHIETIFTVKENHLPFIQIKGDPRFKASEHLASSKGELVDLYLTSVDLELFLEHYDTEVIRYIDGFSFMGQKDIFKTYIDKWTYVKQNNKGAMRTLAKLMLNSLYGKFGTQTDVTPKIPVLEDGVLKLRLREEKLTREPIYTAMASFITSYARGKTIKTAQKVYDRFIYADTDSIHLKGTEIPKELEDEIDDKLLGYWGNEGVFRRARFIKQKCYIEDIALKEENGSLEMAMELSEATDYSLKVTCAGMPDNLKSLVTWENFYKGLTFKEGNLKPKKVKGGTILFSESYTMK